MTLRRCWSRLFAFWLAIFGRVHQTDQWDAHQTRIEGLMEDTNTAVADAPASTSTSAPPSAPAAAEPTVTTDRPSIGDALSVFNEAAKQQGRKTRGRISPTGEPSQPEAPTTQAEGSTTETTAPAQGPVPTPVHIKAVENARLKGRSEAEQEFRQTIGDPAIAREATQWFHRAAQDRPAFLRDVINEALTDPQLRPQVMSLLGQTLGSGARPPATEAVEPQPDFQDAAGNQFYSAKAQQAREAWLIQKAKAEILGEVQPDLDQVRSEREAKQAETAKQQNIAAINTHIAEARKLPYFDQFKDQIRAAALAMPLTSGHPAEEAIVLQRAYWQVVGPELSKLEQQRVVADLKARANASSLNPAATGAPSGIPKNITAKGGGKFGDALKWATAQQAGR